MLFQNCKHTFLSYTVESNCFRQSHSISINACEFVFLELLLMEVKLQLSCYIHTSIIKCWDCGITNDRNLSNVDNHLHQCLAHLLHFLYCLCSSI